MNSIIIISILIHVFIFIQVLRLINILMMSYFDRKTKKYKIYANVDICGSLMIENYKLYKYMKNIGFFLFIFYRNVITDIRTVNRYNFYINTINGISLKLDVKTKSYLLECERTRKLLNLKYKKENLISKFLFFKFIENKDNV